MLVQHYKLIPICALAAVVGSTACRSTQSAIPVSASDFDLEPLVGKWAGEYTSEDTGRNGTISFTLQAGESAASGDVVMLPRSQSRPNSPAGNQTVMMGASGGLPREVLKIHFLRKESRNVTGTLDPYVDPDCSCRVTTTFVGAFTDDATIGGTFTTSRVDRTGPVASGRWRVARVKKL
jgi:hypothetical protein